MSVDNAIIDTMNTSVEDKIAILAELSSRVEAGNYPELLEWVAWHNISLPIATLISMGIFQINPIAEVHINSGFARLLDHLGVEDLGYKHIEDVVGY